MFSHLYPESCVHHFPANIFPIKRFQDILFKFLLLSTNSVTKKIIALRTVYFYNSGSIVATKKICTLSGKLYRDILASLNRENCGLKMVYIFLGKDDKTWRNLYLFSLKTSLWKEVGHFFSTVYPSKNT